MQKTSLLSSFSKLPALAVLGVLFTAQNSILMAQVGENDPSFLNAYDQVNMEQLVTLGLLAMEEENFSEAERIFLDAVQVAKVNYGLTDRNQWIPLRHAIEAQMAQSKFEEVENHLSYFEWLNDEIYQRDFYAYLEGTKILSTLLLKASADINNPLSVRYLIAAKNLNWRAISAIEATLGDQHVELAPWLYNIVLAHYYQSSLIKSNSLMSHVHRSEEDEEISGYTLNVGESMRISYRIGAELLGRIKDIYEDVEDVPTETAALVQIYMADWEMLFGNEEDALTSYKETFETLLAAGIDENQANQVFAQPTVLPAPSLDLSIASLTSPLDGPVKFHAWSPNYPAARLPSEEVAVNADAGTQFMALVKFTLHPLLPAELINNDRIIPLGFNFDDLEVVNATPDNELVRARARYEVSLLQFRPRIENGAPVPFEDVELEYLFPPQSNILSVSNN